MKLKLLGALVALGLLTQPTYASSVEYITDQTTGSIFLTGFNSILGAQGTLSLDFVNVNFPPYDLVTNPIPSWYIFTAGVQGTGIYIPGPFTQILASGNNGFYGGGSECRYNPCTNSINFFIPTGILNIDLGVSTYLDVVGNGSVGTPAYELELSVPDYLSLGPTPLPAALPLFATGLGLMGLLGWRKKRKNAAAMAAA